MADHGPGAEGFHQHPHEHEGAPPHRHPHHHRSDPALAVHQHTHATSFEALTYTVSPLHRLDARAKVIAALVLVLGIVLTAPLRATELALFGALLVAATALGRLPLGRLLVRSAAVLPIAGTIALLAPLQARGGSWNAAGLAEAWSAGGWVVAWGIASKAWLSAYVMLLLAASTRTADLLGALRALKVPGVFVMLLSFIARYVSVLVSQLRTVRTALLSRAGHLRGRALTRSLGSIAGNLFVRSYERGERVYAAMLSRGYTGSLPSVTPARLGAAEALLVLTALLTSAAIALY